MSMAKTSQSIFRTPRANKQIYPPSAIVYKQKADLILAVATPAAQAVAGKTSTIPILGTAITDYVEARLAQSNEEPGLNVSGPPI